MATALTVRCITCGEMYRDTDSHITPRHPGPGGTDCPGSGQYGEVKPQDNG